MLTRMMLIPAQMVAVLPDVLHQPSLNSVAAVPKRRGPFKVLRPVVGLYAVDVVDADSIRWRSDECRGNQGMYALELKRGVCPMSQPDFDIAVLVDPTLEYSTWISPRSVAISTDTTLVGNRIPAFPSYNREPSLIVHPDSISELEQN